MACSQNSEVAADRKVVQQLLNAGHAKRNSPSSTEGLLIENKNVLG
jgi:hypothetical protein